VLRRSKRRRAARGPTSPAHPSTNSSSPLPTRSVTRSTLTTAGTPSSRATIAACDVGVPISVTTAAARWNSGVQPISVVRVIRISPAFRAAATQETRPSGFGDANRGIAGLKAAVGACGPNYRGRSSRRSRSLASRSASTYCPRVIARSSSCASQSGRHVGVASALEYLSGASLQIERWLNKAQKERNWNDNTWNRYYELLSTLFNRATRWKANGVPRMAQNPMLAIERRVGTKKKFRVRIEETAEDKLSAACDTLNRPQHKPHSKLLTWPKVDEIRKRVADGETQSKVAGHFGVSSGLCCQIIKGEIWNPAIYKRGTKGDMMRLRLMAAFDAGVRREEMMLIQLKHINFKPVSVNVEGEQKKLLVVEV